MTAVNRNSCLTPADQAMVAVIKDRAKCLLARWRAGELPEFLDEDWWQALGMAKERSPADLSYFLALAVAMRQQAEAEADYRNGGTA